MKKIPITSKKNKYLDDPEVTIERSKVFKNKVILRKTYIDFYDRIYAAMSRENRYGTIVELGSGGGFIKERIPNAITSDVMKLPMVDMQFSALKLPFKKNSINAIIMVDVFHHINKPEQFLSEASRCLKKGGQIIMIEPACSAFGRFIWKNFHHEPYNPKGGWTFKSTGPLSGANSALPWIVFIRDQKKYKKKFPELQIKKIDTHSPLKYLLSGGFSFKQLLPNSFYPFLIFIEFLLYPLNRDIGLFYTIEIKKV